MEESKKVNTEHFKKKIGNTTYRVESQFRDVVLKESFRDGRKIKTN